MPRSEIVLSYDEAMALCLLLAEAADASVEDESLCRSVWRAASSSMHA